MLLGVLQLVTAALDISALSIIVHWQFKRREPFEPALKVRLADADINAEVIIIEYNPENSFAVAPAVRVAAVQPVE